MAACGGGADSVFYFRLERRGDGTKRCRKIKRRQRSRLASIGRKCDTVWRHDDVDQMRDDIGREKGGDDIGWADANLTRSKMKKIYAADSIGTSKR
jgi:hypothetical protein